jgi:hypothetical protein
LRVVVPPALIPLPAEIAAALIPRIFLLVVEAALLMKILTAVSIPLLETSIRAALDLIPRCATVESTRRKKPPGGLLGA